ncbi:thiamine pyrophosphate-binding protein [Citricoccus sp. NR2]|uniref:thiamine pyrophosphate-binding protein n=1 Tax=Citricoccus sp. NR2 TaxID=3004095 RepID=UPI0022DDA53B|nr:thiamine pyrophosphate-binding protein [Citricoccus sp. NR2]WBL19401.1 thiamine pyrophosphate-binding protein [Citricoccus sp. NR2]
MTITIDSARAQHSVDEPAAQPTVAMAIAAVIRERTDHLFGLMGNGNAHVISELTHSGFPYTSARHEVATVTMADAYFRASGKIAAATTTYGAGFTNALTGLAEARLARIPLVLLVGDRPSSGARFFDIDQTLVCEGLDVEVITVNETEVTAQAHRAFDRAEQTQSPVVLALPYDLATAPVEPADSDAIDSAAPEQAGQAGRTIEAPALTESQRAGLSEAAELLRAARRPLILSGRGVVLSHTGNTLEQVGDHLGALYMNSFTACNVVDSPWNLGIAGGFTRRHRLEVARQADVVVVAGASMNTFQLRYGTLFAADATVIRLESDPHAPAPALENPLHTVHGDLAALAPALLDLVAATPTPENTWRDEVAFVTTPEFGALAPVEDTTELGPDGRLNPRVVFAELEHVLPQRRSLVMDGGHFLGWAPMYLSVPDPRGLVAVGTAFQSIGLGFGSAGGVTMARPDHTTVMITGDGGGLMALADLETVIRTARAAGTRAIVVAVNDAAYGAELHQYAVKGLDDEAMLIDDVDFSALGRALGADGMRMHRLADLQRLREWIDTHETGVFVLDVPVSQSFVAEYMRESVFGPNA